MNPQRPPLDQVAAEIALLSRELSFTGTLLYEGLEKPMNALKAGRAPRALGLADQVKEAESLRGSAAEILGELRLKSADFAQYGRDFSAPDFPELLHMAERECAFWQAFCERSQILLKKLALIADLEKLSPLGRAPIQDAWDEVRALAAAAEAKSE
ncbi:hypothetical protein F9K50_12650 [bacterium]|nr:MAG: hypothetical protein F9K50_12650 [bacterium]